MEEQKSPWLHYCLKSDVTLTNVADDRDASYSILIQPKMAPLRQDMASASAVALQILYALAAILLYIAVQKLIEQRKQKSGRKLQHQRDRQKDQQPEVQYRGDSATDSVGASLEHAQVKGSAKSYAQLLQPTLPESVFTPEPSMLELPSLPCDWEIKPEQLVILKRPDGSPWELGTGAFGKVSSPFDDGCTLLSLPTSSKNVSSDTGVQGRFRWCANCSSQAAA